MGNFQKTIGKFKEKRKLDGGGADNHTKFQNFNAGKVNLKQNVSRRRTQGNLRRGW